MRERDRLALGGLFLAFFIAPPFYDTEEVEGENRMGNFG